MSKLESSGRGQVIRFQRKSNPLLLFYHGERLFQITIGRHLRKTNEHSEVPNLIIRNSEWLLFFNRI